jgi:hypothetical protein
VRVPVIAAGPCRTNRLADDKGTRLSEGQRTDRGANGAHWHRPVAYTESDSAAEDSAVTAAMTSATAGKRFTGNERCAHESCGGEPYDGVAQHYRTFFC